MDNQSTPRPSRSLRRRLGVTLAGLSALAVTSLGGVYLFTEHVIEQDALRNELNAEIRALMDHESRGERIDLISTSLRYYAPGKAPAGFPQLPAETFRRVRFEGRSWQVLTRADAGGGIHLVAHDMTLAEHRERWLLISLAAGVTLAAAGSWLISGWLARRTLSPLTDLVEQIRRIDPLAPAQRPLARTGDADLDVIPDAINPLVLELDHVLRRERTFVDAASHELRTPLAVVRGAIDVLRERGDAHAPVVDRMDRAARRAQEDLDALLALSPAREPAPAVQVDLQQLLPAAAEPYLREGAGTNVVWEWKPPCQVRIEPAAFAIVFTNLLRNALQAAPHGQVRIEASARVVRIVDDGEGLPAEWPTRGETRGRGLGLLIARTLAERHGWELRLEPAQPRGTAALLLLYSNGAG